MKACGIMRLAITGTTGRVGRALASRLASEHEVLELPRGVLDLAGGEGLGRALAEMPFDLLLNPAGLTGLEDCEDHPALAQRVNALGPSLLARECKALGRRLIHFSTDYVFDGYEPGLKDESSPAHPLSIYGLTKLQGEQAVLEAGGLVVRVSWVFGPEKPAFPDGLVADALAGRPLKAVADKLSLPTFTRDLADWMAVLIHHPEAEGIYHACNGGESVSWHGMAEEIVAYLVESGRVPAGTEVAAMSLADFPAMRARRPVHTAMATGKLAGVLGASPRNWRLALREYLKQIAPA